MGKLRTWKCALKISWLRSGGLEYSAVVRLDSHPKSKRILTRRWVTVTPDSEWDYYQTMEYVSSSTKPDSHSDIKCDSPSLPRIPHSRDPIFAHPEPSHQQPPRDHEDISLFSIPIGYAASWPESNQSCLAPNLAFSRLIVTLLTSRARLSPSLPV